MTVESIVFDFGGVLIDWNPRYLYRKVFRDEAEMEYFYPMSARRNGTPLWIKENRFGKALRSFCRFTPAMPKKSKCMIRGGKKCAAT